MMKVLKSILTHIIKQTTTKSFTLEVYFDEKQFMPISDHFNLLLKMLINAYNLMEPEHSQLYPDINYDILFP